MFLNEFLDRIHKLDSTQYIMEDFVDKLNYGYTVVLMCLLFSATTVKTYFLTPIQCYIPNIVGSHEGQAAYITNFCYSEGTYNVPPSEFKIDNSNPNWKEIYADRKIYYYQWVPFILGLQGIICFLPHLAWLCHLNLLSGIDYSLLTKLATEVMKTDFDKRRSTVRSLAKLVHNWVRFYRKDQRSSMKNCFSSCCSRCDRGSADGRRCKTTCGFHCLSKRKGVQLMQVYFSIKAFYCIINILQLLIMSNFLQLKDAAGFRDSNFFAVTFQFALHLLVALLQGKDWQNTEVFPRSGCCAVETRQSSGSNYIFAQCVLPVNMLHEKFYIFLWIWFVMLLLSNFVSIGLWAKRLCRFGCRKNQLKKFFLPERPRDLAKEDAERLADFLMQDGMLVIIMIARNCNEALAAELAREIVSLGLDRGRKFQEPQINGDKLDAIRKSTDDLQSTRNYSTTSLGKASQHGRQSRSHDQEKDKTAKNRDPEHTAILMTNPKTAGGKRAETQFNGHATDEEVRPLKNPNFGLGEA